MIILTKKGVRADGEEGKEYPIAMNEDMINSVEPDGPGSHLFCVGVAHHVEEDFDTVLEIIREAKEG